MDYVEVIRRVQEALGDSSAESWTDVNGVYNAELDEVHQSMRDSGRRMTAKALAEARVECAGRLLSWAFNSPVLTSLPAGLTPEQARTLAHLVVARRKAGLYLALMACARGDLRPCEERRAEYSVHYWYDEPKDDGTVLGPALGWFDDVDAARSRARILGPEYAVQDGNGNIWHPEEPRT